MRGFNLGTINKQFPMFQWLGLSLDNHGPGAMAKYFQTKRRLIERDREDYSMDDAVAVWSVAVGEDLFPWFQSLAFDVDPSRTDLETP